MSTQEVYDFLKNLYPDIADDLNAILDQDIDGHAYASLTHEILIQAFIKKFGVRDKILRHQKKKPLTLNFNSANANREMFANLFATSCDLAPIAKRYKAGTHPDPADLEAKLNQKKKDVGIIKIYMKSKIGNGCKYVCQLPGKTERCNKSAKELKPFADQIKKWNDSHPTYDVMYEDETTAKPAPKPASKPASKPKKIVIEDSDSDVYNDDNAEFFNQTVHTNELIVFKVLNVFILFNSIIH